MAAADKVTDKEPGGWRGRLRAALGSAAAWLPSLPRHGLFLLACLVSFFLEHHALELFGGRTHAAPSGPGLFSAQELYQYAVSTWPRELVPRYTVIVHIDPDTDPTAEGLANNICLQRSYLARLLPLIADQEPAIIVIDKHFPRHGCMQPEPTAALQGAVARVSKRLPVVVGLKIDDRATTADASEWPILIPALSFAPSPKLAEGLTTTDAEPRRIPLGWTVRTDGAAPASWKNGIALAAALIHEPSLFIKAPRLRMLRDERENPVASMIGEGRFSTFQASDFLCADPARAEDLGQACASTKASGRDIAYLRGRIVILGETGVSTDRHETTVVGTVPGTVLQANYLEALLDERYFVPAPEKTNYVAGYVFFVALETALRGRKPLLSVLRLLFLLVVTFAALLVTARYFGYFVNPAVSLLVFALMLISWLRELLLDTGKARHGTQRT